MESGTNATNQNLHLKAMVVSHGVSQSCAPKIPPWLPSLFVSGSADPRRHKVAQAFSAVVARPKIYAVLEGGAHMEPVGQGRMNAFDAHFLGCYLLEDSPQSGAPRQASCNKIYGSTPDSLCKKNNMTTCTVDR